MDNQKEELISLLLKLKVDLHRNERYIRELIELVNDLSLKIEEEKPKPDYEKFEISDIFVWDETKKETKMDCICIRKERRFKILSFDYEEILELLMIPSHQIMKIKRVKLPKEYYVDSVFYDPSGKSFNYIVGSEKFPMHMAGMSLPLCDDEIEYSVIELNHGKDFGIKDKNLGMQEQSL